MFLWCAVHIVHFSLWTHKWFKYKFFNQNSWTKCSLKMFYIYRILDSRFFFWEKKRFKYFQTRKEKFNFKIYRIKSVWFIRLWLRVSWTLTRRISITKRISWTEFYACYSSNPNILRSSLMSNKIFVRACSIAWWWYLLPMQSYQFYTYIEIPVWLFIITAILV